jgi:hypothetical protein
LRGEGRLTKVLIDAGFVPRVLYRTDALQARLRHLSPECLLAEAEKSLPEKARRTLLDKCSSRTENVGLADDIAEAIKARNQMHYGGLLYRRHLGLPVVKRDLVYREIFSLEDVMANLGDLDETLRASILADFRARGTGRELDVLRRMFYRRGAI